MAVEYANPGDSGQTETGEVQFAPFNECPWLLSGEMDYRGGDEYIDDIDEVFEDG